MATPVNQGAPVQDVPPMGGYPPVKAARHLPNRGPHGWVMFAGCGAIMFAGLVAFGMSNEKRRQVKIEKRTARIALVPLLQAEMEQNMAEEVREAAREKYGDWSRRGPDKKALAVDLENLEKQS